MNIILPDHRFNRIVDQWVSWSRAATQAIEKNNEYHWDLSLKSIKSMQFMVAQLGIAEEVREAVHQRLVEIDGSEEAYEASNQKWKEWQEQLKKKRGGKLK
jgi:hypothetical protein